MRSGRLVSWLGVVAALVAASSLAGAAQSGGKPTTGNPTPGTEQPAPPNLKDRIALSGCLRPAPKDASAKAEEVRDDNTPSDARFVLVNAERLNRLPPETGGSAAAASASSRTYRLAGLDSLLSPFAGAKVEISGEIEPRAPGSSTGNPPTLLVEFVQKIASGC